MSANINDKITAVRDTTNPVLTTVASARSIAGTSLSAVSLSGWPTATKVHFITYKKTTSGVIDKTTQCDWEGIVSGTTLGSLTLMSGTDAGNDVGDFIEMAPTAAYAQDLYDGLTQTLNADGTLQTGIVATAKIADGAVTTTKLATGSVTTSTLADSAALGNLDSDAIGTGYLEIGRTTLDTAGNTISVVSLPARKYLSIKVIASATGGTINATLRFNNDSGTNYSNRSSANGGADSTAGSGTFMGLSVTASVADRMFTGEIRNVLAQEKLLVGTMIEQGTAGAANAASRAEVANKWANTSAQINRVDIVNTGTGNFAVGSELIVYGHN